MKSDVKKIIIYLLLPLVTIFLKDFLLTNLTTIAELLKVTKFSQILTVVIYLLVGLSFGYCIKLTFSNKGIYYFTSALYLALLAYIVAYLLGYTQIIPVKYIQFILDNMILYGVWCGMVIMNYKK